MVQWKMPSAKKQSLQIWKWTRKVSARRGAAANISSRQFASESSTATHPRKWKPVLRSFYSVTERGKLPISEYLLKPSYANHISTCEEVKDRAKQHVDQHAKPLHSLPKVQTIYTQRPENWGIDSRQFQTGIGEIIRRKHAP